MPSGLAAFLQGFGGGAQRALDARQRRIETMQALGFQQQARQRTAGTRLGQQRELFGLQRSAREAEAERGRTFSREQAAASRQGQIDLMKAKLGLEKDLGEQRIRELTAPFGGAGAPAIPGMPAAAGAPGAAGVPHPALAEIENIARTQGLPEASRARRAAEQAFLARETDIPAPDIPDAPDIPELLRGKRLPKDFRAFFAKWRLSRFSEKNPESVKREVLAARGVGLDPIERGPAVGAPGFGAILGGGLRLRPGGQPDINALLRRELGKPSTQSERVAARNDFERLSRMRGKALLSRETAQVDVEERRRQASTLVEQMRRRRETTLAIGQGTPLALKRAEREQRAGDLKLMKLRGMSDEQIADVIAPGKEREKVVTIMKDFKDFSPDKIRAFLNTTLFGKLMQDTGIGKNELGRILTEIGKMNE